MAEDFSQYYKEANAEDSIKGRNEVKGRPFWTPPTHKSNWVTSRIRIMPPPANKSDDKFYTWVPLHNSLPGAQQPILCPNRHADLPCPACMASAQYRAAGNEQLRIKFAPTWRALVNVVVLDAKGKVTTDSRPLWWGMPKRTNDDLQQKIEELIANGEDGNITSPRYGRDVFLRRTGEGDRTRYEIAPAQTANPMPPEVMEMLKDLNSLEIEECYELLPQPKIYALLQPPKANGGWDEPEERDPFANAGAVEGEFTAIPERTAEPVADANPFGDDAVPEPVDEDDANPFGTADEAPFDTDEEDGPAPEPAPVTNAPAKVAEARAKLQSKIASSKG